MEINFNGKSLKLDVADDTPLLWVIRDELNMTGTKYGCGISMCGACTVHLNGEPIRSCVTPVSALAGGRITTIEGLDTSSDQAVAKAVQAAWVGLSVPQCGYCQSGQIMAATALLAKNKKPKDEDIDTAMSGNICRCGTYNDIRAAIKKASASLAGGGKSKSASVESTAEVSNV
jgi:isoquinoline 1-oxidoreductase alpha subunit